MVVPESLDTSGTASVGFSVKTDLSLRVPTVMATAGGGMHSSSRQSVHRLEVELFAATRTIVHPLVMLVAGDATFTLTASVPAPCTYVLAVFLFLWCTG